MLEQKDIFFNLIELLRKLHSFFYKAPLDKSGDIPSSDVSSSRAAALKGTSWPL